MEFLLLAVPYRIYSSIALFIDMFHDCFGVEYSYDRYDRSI